MDDLTRNALAAGAGDRAALEQFVRASQADVWRLCRYLGSSGEADDLTQEVYERAIPALRRFEATSSARTWLLTIARRVCADHVRRRQRQRRLLDSVETLARTVDGAARGDRDVDLDLLVADLPDEFGSAFVLTQVLGLSYAEAADVLGCPVGTVRSRVARARERLVESLASGDVTATDEG